MALVTSAAFLSVLQLSRGYSIVSESSLEWPEEYHYNAEEIDLVVGIVKSSEIWYSELLNRSRVDMFGGTTRRYYEYPSVVDDDTEDMKGKIYMFHPSADIDANMKMLCEIIDTWYDLREFLPSFYGMEYKGTQELGEKQLQVWSRGGSFHDMKHEDRLLVYYRNGVLTPYQYESQFMSAKRVIVNKIVNYYNFEDKINLDDVKPDAKDCHPRASSSDLHESLQYHDPAVPTDVDDAFHRYTRHHNKNYEDEEHEMRRMIFEDNWKFITDTNGKNLGYKLSLNEFADHTEEELGYLRGSEVTGSMREGTHPFPHSEEEVEDIASGLPELFDLRMEGVISRVKHQGNCGSCWAFANVATVEGAIARSSGGRLVDLSEQSLVDCAWQYESRGCKGSDSPAAVYDLVLKTGLPTDEEYGPYLEEDGACRIRNMTTRYKIKGYTGITKNSPNAMKVAVYKYGPVTARIQCAKEMMFYSSGIMYDFTCTPGGHNHVITVVGYGHRDGDLYWIIKNSWGEAWGEDGYLLISAKDNNCNVMLDPYYPVV